MHSERPDSAKTPVKRVCLTGVGGGEIASIAPIAFIASIAFRALGLFIASCGRGGRRCFRRGGCEVGRSGRFCWQEQSYSRLLQDLPDSWKGL